MVTTYATVAGIIVSIVTVFIAFKRMRREHEAKIATKDDVRVVDMKLDAYIKAHEELHKLNDKRIKDIHDMVLVMYQNSK